MDKKTSNRKRKNKSFQFNIDPKILLGIIIGLIVVVIILLIIILSNQGKSSETNALSSNSERITISTDANKETTTSEETTTISQSSNNGFTEVNGRMVYDDDSYNTITGIDVSEWNGDIDWKSVKEDGIDFAIMRLGYRGYETGKIVYDTMIDSYLADAKEAGLQTGIYFVSQAVDEDEAIEEAKLCLEYAEKYGSTMPIYIDLESNSGSDTRVDDNTKEDWTNIAKAFCDTINESGLKGGIYSNETWASKYLNVDELADYDLWFANYETIPSFSTGMDMWQYSCTGSVEGIETDTDLNVRIEKK